MIIFMNCNDYLRIFSGTSRDINIRRRFSALLLIPEIMLPYRPGEGGSESDGTVGVQSRGGATAARPLTSQRCGAAIPLTSQRVILRRTDAVAAGVLADDVAWPRRALSAGDVLSK